MMAGLCQHLTGSARRGGHPDPAEHADQRQQRDLERRGDVVLIAKTGTSTLQATAPNLMGGRSESTPERGGWRRPGQRGPFDLGHSPRDSSATGQRLGFLPVSAAAGLLSSDAATCQQAPVSALDQLGAARSPATRWGRRGHPCHTAADHGLRADQSWLWLGTCAAPARAPWSLALVCALSGVFILLRRSQRRRSTLGCVTGAGWLDRASWSC